MQLARRVEKCTEPVVCLVGDVRNGDRVAAESSFRGGNGAGRRRGQREDEVVHIGCCESKSAAEDVDPRANEDHARPSLLRERRARPRVDDHPLAVEGETSRSNLPRCHRLTSARLDWVCDEGRSQLQAER